LPTLPTSRRPTSPRTSRTRTLHELIGDPIGMTNFHVSQCEYTKPDVDSIDPTYVFRMTAVDLVKFVERKWGSYEGPQIVPAGWIERSLTSHTVIPNGNSFGYLWEVCQAGRLFGVDLGPAASGFSGFRGHYVVGFPSDELALVYAHCYDLVGKATLQPANSQSFFGRSRRGLWTEAFTSGS
jgi:CubicO group peptidase (beta-lactamase class C family)